MIDNKIIWFTNVDYFLINKHDIYDIHIFIEYVYNWKKLMTCPFSYLLIQING